MILIDTYKNISQQSSNIYKWTPVIIPLYVRVNDHCRVPVLVPHSDITSPVSVKSIFSFQSLKK